MKILNKKTILDFLFPKYCLSCHKLNDSYLCFSCLKKINFIGKIKNYKADNISALFAISDFQDKTIKTLIRAYAQQGIKEINIILAELLRLFWQGRNVHLNINYAVLPCPQNKLNTKRCGYNANLEIAKIFAKQFGYYLLTNSKEYKINCQNIIILTTNFYKTKKMETLIKNLALNKNKITILSISLDFK